jgi:hypothetical protein
MKKQHTNEIEVLTNVAMSQTESGYSEYQF